MNAKCFYFIIPVLLLFPGFTNKPNGLETLSAPEQDAGFNSAAPANPNIIIIIPDDLGWSDVGYHGSVVKTPNIDKLAKTGIRLDQHYVMPTCTPTRVSLMTGKYPSRYGITGPAYGEVIDLGDPTLASILRDNGYFTAIAGKWHLGSPPYTPLKYGFQSSYGYFDGQIDPYTHEYKMETKLTGRESWHRNDEYLVEEGHVTDLLTAEAIRIIEEERSDPFFLYLAHHVPHFPLDEPDEWLSLYDDLFMHPSRKLFAASVSHMDDGIGKIIDALERAGKRENTLVLFISDNGGQHSWHSKTEYQGKYADKPHIVLGNNYPLRGWKGELYEGGIRVPAIANWPGTLQPGELGSPVHVSDWLPTLCDLIGCKNNPKEQKIDGPARMKRSSDGPARTKLRSDEPTRMKRSLDGKNIWPHLTGEQPIAEERTLYWKTNRAYAVREGDWKLLVEHNTGNTELYDLKNDFRETSDLTKKHPEKVKHLLLLMNQIMENDRDR